MTLCVAWRFTEPGQDKVCFAADTCVTTAYGPMKFGGVKIFELPLRYHEPAPAGQTPKIWQKTYGLAFSGDYLAAFLVKEMVAALLVELTGPGDETLAEFENVCAVVAKFHGHFYRQIKSSLQAGQRLEFFFGGFCPVKQKVRVARFSIIKDQHAKDVSSFKEILTRPLGESFETSGDLAACQRYQQLLNLSLSGPPCRVHYAAARRLWDVIRDPDHKTVDGAIQYGAFNAAGDFELTGTGMLDLASPRPEVKIFIRGTDAENIHVPGYLDLHLRYSASMPFNEDVASFEHDGFYSPPQDRVERDEIITLLPVDARWKDQYHKERGLLRRILRGARRIEHIGSTAVALPAVPVIDMMAGFLDPVDIGPLRNALASADYIFVGPREKGEWYLFRKRTTPNINLYIVPFEGVFWRSSLNIRDYLRSNSGAASNYARDKVRILNRGSWTLMRYNHFKATVLAAITANAEKWASTRRIAPPSRWPTRMIGSIRARCSFLRWP